MSNETPDLISSQAIRLGLGTLIDQVEAGVAIAFNGRFVFVNLHLAQMLGYTGDEMVTGMSAFHILHPQDRQRARERVRTRQTDAPSEIYDTRFVRKDGTRVDARTCGRRVMLDGKLVDLFTVSDTSELQQALGVADRKARMLVQSEKLCANGSVEIDLRRGWLRFSSGMWALLDVPVSEDAVTRRRAIEWLPPEDRAAVNAAWRDAQVGEPFELQHRIKRADGSHRLVHQRGLIVASALGRPASGVIIIQDITVQRNAERRIQELANYHPVSGLPNRAHLLQLMDARLIASDAQTPGVTLLAIGVPQVETVRESLGYDVGDAFVLALSSRLAAAMQPGELLAHLGEGDFAVLVAAESEGADDVVLELTRRIHAALSAPEHVGTSEVFLAHAIGVARSVSDGQDANQLLESARSALQEEAGAPGDGVRFFSPQSNRPAIRRMAVEAALRYALSRNELKLFYQPQINLRSGTMVSVEAVLRWTSTTMGSVSPAEFIPVAEKTGHILEIGAWVIAEACRQAALWRRAGMKGLRVHVKISAVQLAQADLAQRIQASLIEEGGEPSLLGVEVTESMLASDVDQAARSLSALRALGIEISLDDFGTGYSNLSMLRSLPIDVIKIDRSFVHDVTASPSDVSVTRAVIAMAHSLQMKVLAEGVETEGQLALLIANQCDAMQGHLYSPAICADELEALWRERPSLPARYVSRPARQRTLLLVDDEENIVASLKRLLRRSGYQIITALSAAEGLLRLSEVEVDVIISDQRMPGMTGVEFLRRAKELYPHTVRIVLSGYTELQSITDAINEGAIYKFLTKPWEDDLLRANIEEAFRQKELADDNRRLDREVRQANLELADVNDKLQHALSSQREQVSLAESQGNSARAALFSVAVPVIGLDEDGMIAFVNAECAKQLPELPSFLGCDASEALPAELLAALRRPDSEPSLMVLNGHRYLAAVRSIPGATRPQGYLISLSLQVEAALSPPPCA